ncbi:hypothetical protein JCM8547_009218 [Rhodosporidiobolus lusitaniae]
MVLGSRLQGLDGRTGAFIKPVNSFHRSDAISRASHTMGQSVAAFVEGKNVPEGGVAEAAPAPKAAAHQ